MRTIIAYIIGAAIALIGIEYLPLSDFSTNELIILLIVICATYCLGGFAWNNAIRKE